MNWLSSFLSYFPSFPYALKKGTYFNIQMQQFIFFQLLHASCWGEKNNNNDDIYSVYQEP